MALQECGLVIAEMEAANLTRIDTARLGTQSREFIGHCLSQHAATAVLRPFWLHVNPCGGGDRTDIAHLLSITPPLESNSYVRMQHRIAFHVGGAQSYAASFKEHHSFRFRRASNLHGPTLHAEV